MSAPYTNSNLSPQRLSSNRKSKARRAARAFSVKSSLDPRSSIKASSLEACRLPCLVDPCALLHRMTMKNGARAPGHWRGGGRSAAALNLRPRAVL